MALAILCDSPLFQENEIPLIYDTVIEQYKLETDEYYRAAIIFRIGYLFQGSGQYLEEHQTKTAELIHSVYQSDSNEELRLVASLMLPILARDQTPSEVVRDLVEIIANPPQQLTPDGKSTQSKSPLGMRARIGIDAIALRSMWYLDDSIRFLSLESALKSTQDKWKALDIAVHLMHWTFIAFAPPYKS